MDEGENQPVDFLVVGGGINGVGIARDAAGRGYSVVLCEKGDLAEGTSSASSKLIHGGLRYLEYYEFGLVRKALKEREVLLRAAPHIVRPMDFVLPHAPHLRPAWMIRMGLFLYDHIGGRETLPGSKGLNLRTDPAGQPLKREYAKGFQYADCQVDDARLVVLNAVGAREKGAEILTHCALLRAERVGDVWHARLRDERTGGERAVRARSLVNAAGPWLGDVLSGPLEKKGARKLRLVKGSHIVVPRIEGADRAYILQNPDNRVVFVLPFEQDFSLIGTTEVELSAVPDQPEITPEETAYLCDSVNQYFSRTIGPGDVVWSFAGVRPLVGDEGLDASKVSRDYLLDLEAPEDGAPLLSIVGGKVTTYRVLAEDALAKLRPHLGDSGAEWTMGAPLPGGDMIDADFNTFLTNFCADYPWLPERLAERLAHGYGTRANTIIGAAQSLAGLGEELMPGFFEAELAYLCAQEWAEDADDVLWRRTKLGLWSSREDRERLARRLES